VFESSNPEFYLAHFDLSDIAGSFGLMKTAGPSGLPILMDTFVRLTKSPVVSIAKIRGRARGVGSEFVLACDMRFASREKTVLAQVEVGSGAHPGGGGTERLPALVGRGRALEIIIGSDDFDGQTAERYGYVNRALPDAELDGFVDKFARRIATFDRRPIEAAKNLVNQVSLPSADRLLDGSNSFLTSVAWPEAERRFQALFERGLNKPGDTENRFGELLGTLLDKNVRPTCARLSSARSALRRASPSTTIPFFDPTSRMVKPSGPRRISAWAFEAQPSGSEISRPPSAAMRTARCSPRPIRTTSTPASE